MEFGGPSEATGATTGRSFDSRGTQRERLLIGLGRFRATGASRWGFDAVGGVGAVFQHHEARVAECATCPVVLSTTLEHRAPAFVIGADVPLRVGGALWIGLVARYQVLARGTHQSQINEAVVPWQYEWKSSHRFSIGADVRIGQ